ncbi:transposase [Hymenobacter armeniacus]|uniref:Transposase n=1 Tax=Hymenobacter armeniacus TaxID=2771358 RepID=A0ABR8JVV4_9BACT|nr:transposase [Hymenobacter armeniacus]MBD2723041.1 transposase [Hymenobacter armeniacus]
MPISLITFRLHGTIPAATGRELQAERRRAHEAGAEHRRAQKQFFAAFDAVLDRAPIGPRYFDSEKMAEALAGEILMLEETGFAVLGFAILPNHVHLVVLLPETSNLSFAKAIDLLHLRTGTACRRLVRPKLPPEAEFWQVGWQEYEVQDEAELTRLLAYVRGNARAAGLPARFQEWPYVNE